MAHVVVLGAGRVPLPTAHEMKGQLRAGDRITSEQSAMSAPGVAKLEAK